MSVLRRLFGHGRASRGTSRFDAYYARLLEQGSGYPTADEARQDLRNSEKTFSTFGWPR